MVKETDTVKAYWDKIKKLKYELESADAVIIGGGAGLSTSAGFQYDKERFHKYFADFEKRYGFHDMYSGGFYPYRTLEEYWAYWSRYISVNRYIEAPKTVYQDLFRLIKDKDYFVITTNVDHCFQKAGFDKKRLFYTQGDYGLFQCSVPCCNETYDNKDIIAEMRAHEQDMKIPTDLIPRCPHCQKPLTVNLRSDERFVQDKGWDKAAKRYRKFLSEREHQHFLYLELGVGYNTPIIIKYPFWQMTADNENATYSCINYGEASCPKAIDKRSICINADIGKVIKDLGGYHA